ncbi:hypothetical protein WMF31_35695 [Sorangium sp. So ce1036]|uniref:hypothetical protein n=1 Tax=Sorangium sp. So ce1036 TaxID=3133328 RepID=UPI003F01A3D8
MGQREGEGVSGKYILIEAPNFNNAASETEAMTSYLRLGAVKDPSIAASPGAPRASGEDLAALVTSFVDDDRVRDGCPQFTPVAERKAETAKLHTKGGWRDHSDGNRITTTRGDKVEVVQGNYRMLVRGRQDHDSGWDVSGGHVSETGITFEGSSEIRWVQNYDGTWRVIEESIKGDVFTTYHGDTHDVYSGNLKESITGSAAPAKGKENPRITDRTWARSIESYTGSSALPVPSIKDETWADVIESTTTATTMRDTTECAGAIESTTKATSMTSTTTVTSMTDTTTASSMTSTTVCPSIKDTTIGNTVSTIIGTETEIVSGDVTELTIGSEQSITMGTVLDITIALMMDICIAGKIEVNIGAGISVDLDATYEITPKKIQAAAQRLATGTTHTQVGAQHSFL